MHNFLAIDWARIGWALGGHRAVGRLAALRKRLHSIALHAARTSSTFRPKVDFNFFLRDLNMGGHGDWNHLRHGVSPLCMAPLVDDRRARGAVYK